MGETAITQNDDRLIILFHELEACGKAWEKYDYKKNPNCTDASDEEINKVADLENDIRENMVRERAETLAGLKAKMKSVEILNNIEEVSWGDRIEDANSNAERVAWSFIRDLVENASLLNLNDGPEQTKTS